MKIKNDLIKKSIAAIENPTAAFIGQVELYAGQIEKLAIVDAEKAQDLIKFWNVLIENKFNGFFDVPDVIYHASIGLNQSSLKKIKRSQGKYFWNKYVDPEFKKSKAMDEGNFIHDLLLRPENLGNYYNDDELCDWAAKAYEDANDKPAKNVRGTAIYKEQKAAITKEGRILIDGKLFNNIQVLKSEILENPYLKKLHHGAFVEKGMYCICKHTGLILRGKTDLISVDGYIVDYKTLDDKLSLDPEQIGRHIFNLGQYLQAPHYEHIFQMIQGRKSKGFLYAHIERRPPFEMNIGPLDAGAEDKADQDYWDLMDQAKKGYAEKFKNRKKDIQLNVIAFPHWVFNQ